MMSKEEIQEAEFVEVEEKEQDESEPQVEDLTAEYPTEPTESLRVRVILHDNSTIDFTISGLTPEDYKDWLSHVVVNTKVADGFLIGKAFIQDSKVKYFEQLN